MDINIVICLLLILGIAYLVRKISKRTDRSTEANKLRSNMPRRNELREASIIDSYDFACELVDGFLANAQKNARLGLRSANYSSFNPDPQQRSSVVIRAVKSRLRKEGFSLVSVEKEGSGTYTVDAFW